MGRYLDGSTEYLAVGAASAAFATALVARKQYVLSANTDLWWRIGTDASAAAGSNFLKAGDARIIKTSESSKTLRVIQDSAAGKASLSRYQP